EPASACLAKVGGLERKSQNVIRQADVRSVSVDELLEAPAVPAEKVETAARCAYTPDHDLVVGAIVLPSTGRHVPVRVEVHDGDRVVRESPDVSGLEGDETAI